MVVACPSLDEALEGGVSQISPKHPKGDALMGSRVMGSRRC